MEETTLNERSKGRVAYPFLRTVHVCNYKSIGNCSVDLHPLTVLVGRNGSGKSNFLDALHFVADALRSSLDHSFRDRGGVSEVRRISKGHPRNLLIELELLLTENVRAIYGFEIAARVQGAFAIKRERIRLISPEGKILHHFERQEQDLLDSSEARMPPLSEDRLFLANAAGLPEFRAAFDALTGMGFYNLNPEAMKELQSPRPLCIQPRQAP